MGTESIHSAFVDTKEIQNNELLHRVMEHKKKYGIPYTRKQELYVKSILKKAPELKGNLLYHTLVGSGLREVDKEKMLCEDPHGYITYYLDHFESDYMEPEFVPFPEAKPKKTQEVQQHFVERIEGACC